jgi:phosphoribosylformimino-5-aminoimidazole carboxamide ribotide isomerase
VTYAGGVHDLQDLSEIREASGGYMDVTVGSALDLFGGSLTLDQLIRACH